MPSGLMVIGTDTGVGKTLVSAGILGMLRSAGYNACYFKPILSGAKQGRKNLQPGDTDFVKQVSGLREDSSWMTPYLFRNPVSPHLASRLEGREISPDFIRQRFRELAGKYDVIIAEACGGLAVPIRNDGYMQYHLIRDLGLPCILVARTTLGTINHTLLTLALAEKEKIDIKGILFNGYTGNFLELDNIETIGKLSGFPVLGVLPEIRKMGRGNMRKENIRQWMKMSVDLDSIAGCLEMVKP